MEQMEEAKDPLNLMVLLVPAVILFFQYLAKARQEVAEAAGEQVAAVRELELEAVRGLQMELDTLELAMAQEAVAVLQ